MILPILHYKIFPTELNTLFLNTVFFYVCHSYFQYLFSSFSSNILFCSPVERSLQSIFSFLNWIYWGDIGSQNHTSFKCTTQRNITCTLHHVSIWDFTQSKVSFCPRLCPLCPPPLTPYPHLPLAVITLLFLPACYVYVFLLNPFTFFHPASQASSLLTVICLFHVSMPLFLFCSSVYSVY